MPLIKAGNLNLQENLDLAVDAYNAKLMANAFNPFTVQLPNVGANVSTNTGIDYRNIPYDVPSHVTPEEMPFFLAGQQDNWQRLGLTVANIIPNIGFGVVEAVGYLGELPSLFWGGGDFSNALTRAAQGQRNMFGEIHEPVYGDGVMNKITNPAWWVVNGGGLVESVAEFGLMGGGIGGAAAFGAKAAANALALTAKASRAAMGVAQGFTAATTGYLEGAMTAANVYNQVYEHKLAQGFGFDVAKQEASAAAAKTARLNTVIIGALNLGAVAPLFRTADDIATNAKYARDMGLTKAANETMEQFNQRIAGLEFAEASLKNRYKLFEDWFGASGVKTPFSKNAVTNAQESAKESLEELMNVVAEQEGLQRGGIEDEKSFLSTVIDSFKSEEGILSMMLGAIGGLGESQIIKRLPINRYQETEPGVDAEGRPINVPVGSKRWVSSNFLEDKEAKDKFELYKKSVLDDWTLFRENQETIKQMSALLEGADEADKESIKVQMELAKQKLFNFASYSSIKNGNPDTLINMLEEVANLDNTTILSDEIDAKIAELKTQLSTTTDPQLQKSVQSAILDLETQATPLRGKTAAMAAGVAVDNTDNSYKTIATEKIKAIKELIPEYNEMMNRFNFGDEGTYGMAKYLFLIRAEEIAIEQMIKDLEGKFGTDLSFKDFETTVANDHGPDTAVWLKSKTLLTSLQKDLKKKTKVFSEFEDTLNSADPDLFTLRTKMNANGIPTSHLPSDVSVDMLRDALNEYKKEYFENAKDDMDVLTDEVESSLQKIVADKAIDETLPDGTVVKKYDIDAVTAELNKILQREIHKVTRIANATAQIKNLRQRHKFLTDRRIGLEDVKGRKQFIAYAKEQIALAGKSGGPQTTTSNERTVLLFKQELVAKGYTPDQANQIANALMTGTPVTDAALKNITITGYQGPLKGKRFIMYFNSDGTVRLRQDGNKHTGVEHWYVRNDKTTVFKPGDPRRKLLDKKKKPVKGHHIGGVINPLYLMSTVRVMSIQEAEEARLMDDLGIRRKSAIDASRDLMQRQADKIKATQNNVDIINAAVQTIEMIDKDYGDSVDRFADSIVSIIFTMDQELLDAGAPGLTPSWVDDALSARAELIISMRDLLSDINLEFEIAEDAILNDPNLNNVQKTAKLNVLKVKKQQQLQRKVAAINKKAFALFKKLAGASAAVIGLNRQQKAVAVATQARQMLNDTMGKFPALQKVYNETSNLDNLARIRQAISEYKAQAALLKSEIDDTETTLNVVTDYLTDLRRIPLRFFQSTKIIDNLSRLAEAELMSVFTTDYLNFLSSLEASMLDAKKYLVGELLKDKDVQKKLADATDPLTMWLNDVSNNTNLLAFANSVTVGYTPPAGLTAYAKKVKDLAAGGFKIDSLENLIKGEEVLSMQDIIRDMKDSLTDDYNAVSAQLRELEATRDKQLHQIKLLIKAVPSAVNNASLEVFEANLERLGLDVENASKYLVPLELGMVDHPAVLMLYEKIKRLKEQELLQAGSPALTPAQMDTYVTQELENLKPSTPYIDGSEPLMQEIVSTWETLQNKIDALLANPENRKVKVINELAKLAFNYKINYHYEEIFKRHLKANTIFRPHDTTDSDFSGTFFYDGYTINPKVVSMTTTTGPVETNKIQSILSNEIVINHAVLGIHNMTTGALLDPADSNDQATIREHLPTERWFSFTAAETTAVKIRNKKLLFMATPLDKLIQSVEEDYNAKNESESRVLLEELVAFREKVIAAKGTGAVATTLVVLPFGDDNKVVMHAAKYEELINGQKAGVPWTVLRDADTLFPVSTANNNLLSTDKNKITLAWNTVLKKVNKVKFKVLKDGTVEFMDGKGNTIQFTDEQGNKTNTITLDTNLDARQQFNVINDWRIQVALQLLKEEYLTFLDSAGKGSTMIAKAVTPGINFAVSKRQADGTLSAASRPLSTVTKRTNGKLEGKIMIAKNNTVQANPQFSLGQLVYEHNGIMTPTINTQFKDLANSDEFFALFMYAMLAANNSKVKSFDHLVVETGTTTSAGGTIHYNRNDDHPSSAIPLFPAGSSQTSILRTFLNYGKVFTQGAHNTNKDQVYFQSGKVNFIHKDATGKFVHETVDIGAIVNADGSLNLKHPDLASLREYFDSKYVNVNDLMLKRDQAGRPVFLPTLKSTAYNKATKTIKVSDTKTDVQMDKIDYSIWLAEQVLKVQDNAKLMDIVGRTRGQRNIVLGFQTVEEKSTKSSKSFRESLPKPEDMKKKSQQNNKSDSAKEPPTSSEVTDAHKAAAKAIFQSRNTDDNFKRPVVGKTPDIVMSEAHDNIRKIFGDEFADTHFESVMGLINSEAIGQFTADGRILISNLATKGTEFHEAFHRVWRLFVPAHQREAIIAKFKTRENWRALVEQKREEGYKGTDEYIIEEILADDFMDYALNNPTRIGEALPWYKKLWNFLVSLFKPGNIEVLFDDILSGKFTDNAVVYKGESADKKIKVVSSGSVQGDTYSDVEITDKMFLEASDSLILDVFKTLRDANQLTDFTKRRVDLLGLVNIHIPTLIDRVQAEINHLQNPIAERADRVISGLATSKAREDFKSKVIKEISHIDFGADVYRTGIQATINEVFRGRTNKVADPTFLKGLGLLELAVLNEAKKYYETSRRRNEVLSEMQHLVDHLMLLSRAIDVVNSEVPIGTLYKETAASILATSPFIKRLSNFAKSLHIEVNEEVEYTNLNDDRLSEEDLLDSGVSPDISNYKVSFELDAREKMSGTIKLLLATLSGKRGTYIRSAETLTDWNKNVSILLNHFADIPPKYALEALVELSSTHPQFGELLDFFAEFDNNEYVLSDSLERQQLFAEFTKALDNHNYDMSIQMMRTETIDNETVLQVYPADANVNSSANNVLQKWQEDLENNLKEASLQSLANSISAKGADKDAEVLREVMLRLSIPFTEQLFTRDGDGVMLYKKLRATAPEGGTNAFDELILNLLAELQNQRNLTVVNMFGSTSPIKGTINKIAEVIAMSNQDKSLSIVNGEGKMYFTVNQHSYISSVLGRVNHLLTTTNVNAYYSKLLKKDTALINKIRNTVIADLNAFGLPTNNIEKINRLTLIYDLFPSIFMLPASNSSVWKYNVLNHTPSAKLPFKLIIKDAIKGANSSEGIHLSDGNLVDIAMTTLSSQVYGQFKSTQHADRSIFYFYETPLFIPYQSSLGLAYARTTQQLLRYVADEVLAHRAEVRNPSGIMEQERLLSPTKYNGSFQSIPPGIINTSGYTLIDDNLWAAIVNATIGLTSIKDIVNVLKVVSADGNSLQNRLQFFAKKRSEEYVSSLVNFNLLGSATYDPQLLGFNPYSNNISDEQRKLLLDKNKGEATAHQIAKIAWLNQFLSHIEEEKMLGGLSVAYGTAANKFKRFSLHSGTGDFLSVTDEKIDLINSRSSIHGIHYKQETGFMSHMIAKEEEYVSSVVAEGVENSHLYHRTYHQYLDLYRKLGIRNPEGRARKEAKKFVSAYEGMNENDGMSWINPFAYRAYMIYNSNWSTEMDNTFDFEMYIYADAIRAIEETEQTGIEAQYTPLDVLFDQWIELKGYQDMREEFYSKIFTPHTTLKPQSVGPIYRNSSMREAIMRDNLKSVLAARKTAFDSLSPMLLRGDSPSTRTKQFEMLRHMISNGVDVIFMESGAKVGRTPTFTWYDANKNFNANAFSTIEIRRHLAFLDWNDVKDQQRIDPKQKEKIIDSSQARKNIVAGMMHKGVPIDFINSSDLTTFEDIKTEWDNFSEDEKIEHSEIYGLTVEYRNVRNQITKRLLDDLDREINFSFQTKSYEARPNTNPLSSIVRLLKQNAENRSYSSNVIKQIENILQSGYLESLPNRKRVESLLTSIISNKALKQKRFGTSVPQVTATGMEPINVRRENNESPLDFYMLEQDENGNLYTKASEVIMPIPDKYLKQAMKHYDTTNPFLAVERFNADIQNGAISVKMLALRIPNQQLSSNDWVVPAKFYVPIKNNYVYVASESTVKVGSDFDIDKLSIYFPSLDNNMRPFTVSRLEPSEEDLYNHRQYMQAVDTKLKTTLVKDLGIEHLKDLVNELKLFYPPSAEFAVTLLSQINNLTVSYVTRHLTSLYEESADSDSKDLIDDILFMIRDAGIRHVENSLTEAKERLRTELMQNSSWLEWSSTPALENLLLEIQGRLLTHPVNHVSLLKPIASEESKSIAAAHNINTDIRSMTVTLDPMTNIENGVYFVHGKKGVGVLATSLNVKAILMNIPDVNINSSFYSEYEGRTVPVVNLFSDQPFDFSTLVDEEGTITLDTTSEMITLQVDNVKLLISTKMGFNMDTLGLAGFLSNTGVSLRKIVGLLQKTLPYYKAKDVNDAEHVVFSKKKMTDANFKKEYVQSMIDRLNSRNKSMLEALIFSQGDGIFLNYEKAHELRAHMNDDQSPLQEIISTLYLIDLESIGGAYFELVQGLSMDNKSHKNLISAEKHAQLRARLADPTDPRNLLSAQSFSRATQLAATASFKDVQEKYIDVMKPLYILEKPEFKRIFDFVIGMLPANTPSEKLERFSDTYINSLLVYSMVNLNVLGEAVASKELHNADSRVSEALVNFYNLLFSSNNIPDSQVLFEYFRAIKSALNLEDDAVLNLVEQQKFKTVLPALKMSNRTLPALTIEDLIEKVDAHTKPKMMLLNLISLAQSGVNNSPFSFEKILPFEQVRQTIVNEAISRINRLEKKEEFMLRYTEWFFAAYPYFNNSQRVNRNRQSKGLTPTPYNLLITPDGGVSIGRRVLGDTSLILFRDNLNRTPSLKLGAPKPIVPEGAVTLTHRKGVPQDIYLKDNYKASISPFYIGYGDPGTSTNLYAMDYERIRGEGSLNDGLLAALEADPDFVKDVNVFVSVNRTLSDENREKTLNAVRKLIAAGANIIMDSSDYLAKSVANVGERTIQKELRNIKGISVTSKSHGYGFNRIVSYNIFKGPRELENCKIP